METTLKLRDDECVTWDYDEEADVLYISFGQPKPALALDFPEGVLVRYREEDGLLVGFTIIGVSEMLKTKAAGGPRPRPRSRAPAP